ncbi:MAG: class 1 isoprenoid biosynthesis enzyme [Planctomycetes bacterium]|nr:class 1 isoprenoid biosynthesis enzyme [Planctomycetota bacterium]
MTLDPVFRSQEAVRQIQKDGFLQNMADSLQAHHDAIRHIHRLMPDVLDARYLAEPDGEEQGLEFLQTHFFLVLFHSIFKTLGCSPERLTFYARANFCIKGIVTAGDNLFDDEAKKLLPLAVENAGARFESILQMLCFDRLTHRVCEDAVAEGWITGEDARAFHRALLDRLAHIGTLEGSEENGVDDILPVDEMIEKVHRVRGGALFSLAFVAPGVIEKGETLARFREAEQAIRDLGTAFQIVDDLTDFEFDLTRKSHNILFAAAYYNDDPAVRSAIRALLNGKAPERGMVEGVFAECAQSVLTRAREEGRRAFDRLAGLGFWFPPERSDSLIHAIVGIEGVARIESLTSGS